MKKLRTPFLFLLAASCLLSSCSYNQFGAIASGSSLGGMFGSSIGGLMGGPRGADKGTLAGMVIGGAVGAAVTSSATRANRQNRQATEVRQNDRDYTTYDGRYDSSAPSAVSYGSYNSPDYRVPDAAETDLQRISIDNIHFLDANNNRRLDRDEEAYIVFDIYNHSDITLYNLAPYVKSSSKHVILSPAATIAELRPGQGVRYKTAVRAIGNVRKGAVTFSVRFGKGRQAVTAASFVIDAQ